MRPRPPPVVHSRAVPFSTGRLILRGKDVGGVELDRAGGEWEFGRFSPTDNFAPFAPLFQEWVDLLAARLNSVTARDDLADRITEVERAIDDLGARVRFDTGEEYAVARLNINGNDVEWVRR